MKNKQKTNKEKSILIDEIESLKNELKQLKTKPEPEQEPKPKPKLIQVVETPQVIKTEQNFANMDILNMLKSSY